MGHRTDDNRTLWAVGLVMIGHQVHRTGDDRALWAIGPVTIDVRAIGLVTIGHYGP